MINNLKWSFLKTLAKSLKLVIRCHFQYVSAKRFVKQKDDYDL